MIHSLTILFLILTPFGVLADSKPHIIFILADDLGWNDVGFHGSGQILTPNIDALAYTGLMLHNYYVTPICTPSRSALMTGKYPIHTGMQHSVLKAAEPRGLPLNEKLLPQYLKQLGYSTHIVGKWHLGHYKKEYTPLYRGFDSHLGFWTGHHDYFDHTAVEEEQWGFDMRRGLDPAWDLHGKYSTRVFGSEAVKIIKNHTTSQPLFLYIAHAATHSANPYNPLPAPMETLSKNLACDTVSQRCNFAAMAQEMDTTIGLVIKALYEKNMLNNSIIVFSTDNGGPAAGFNLNHASNWPLRGVKNTLFEGGVRGTGILWSPLLTRTGRVTKQLMHISDWLPTFLAAAAAAAASNTTTNFNIDGINLWDALKNDQESPRKSILHNIDDIYGNAAITMGNFKLLKGSTYNGTYDGHYGPDGRKIRYNEQLILKHPTSNYLRNIGMILSAKGILSLREKATLKQCPDKNNNLPPCNPIKKLCLVNISEDYCEQNDLSTTHPEVLKELTEELEKYRASALPPGNLPLDKKADPNLWDHTWTNFGDYQMPL
ncbi:arylsulfatase B [Leptopilina heterotoma]|uniref:arylsulfatase B n=1 Tax=Leptopilina heterotoma TaxID=63436 RepID=UPI001CA7C8F0|nr:arylsulfatase B [Leptopilina heterotoma]XP_043482501.1 arylsulfatase B [Leptopilina heterotoma]XP_043482502.1 arylsulfatase B [Leptopilina heterotoma]